MRFGLKVRYYEVDEYGHVNHANYVHYLETARIDALETVGLSLRSFDFNSPGTAVSEEQEGRNGCCQPSRKV